VLASHNYLQEVEASGSAVPLAIALEREAGRVSVYRTRIFPSGHPKAAASLLYAARVMKTLLWQRGGWRVVVGGPPEVGYHLRRLYSPSGPRAFDAEFMGGVYEKPFRVEVAEAGTVPAARENSLAVGRHLEGCRIGFDAGASDHKVAALIDGQVVFTQEAPWDPRHQSDPRYHYRQINSALSAARAHLPRVDAIGISAAGIYRDNRVRVASLFRAVPPEVFKSQVQNLFLRLQQEWGGVPLLVANDGDVAALAGAMTLEADRVLGLALGSSEAAGYVNQQGHLTGWLNELAFIPIDLNPAAPRDEWSGEIGCGSHYLSQQAVLRLAGVAGLALQESKPAAEKLEEVQRLLAAGDERAAAIFATLGCYLGYALAYYADFYELAHVLILGRVTSGEGGNILLRQARRVLREEFPDLNERLALHLPSEAERRVGQAVAAASLPVVRPR